MIKYQREMLAYLSEVEVLRYLLGHKRVLI
jgi:hypothetical protein